MSNETDSVSKDDFVITPGGPRPRSSVKHVAPGEVVIRKDDDSYNVVSRKRSEQKVD
jgi:hypothetical protein